MLFTWSTKDLCIVFRSWRVDGVLSLLLSLAAIVALGAGYEAVRELSRRYDASVAASRIDASPSKCCPLQPRCCAGRVSGAAPKKRRGGGVSGHRPVSFG
jgi:Ctr copper transporter family